MSLFSGVGGLCSLGLGAAGHEVVGMCEIDPQARRVLRHHHPDTPLHDDVTTLDGSDWHGRVDIVCGGSPCQDLSVAGRREGLGGDRSGLFWHQCRIAAQSAARWVLWENVAGALSSNDGKDFAAVLWGLTGVEPAVPEDGWGKVGVCVGPYRTAVWRLLDARWFGVAQRRRRVFVVAGPGAGCGLEILVEPESCGGGTGSRPTAGQDVAGTLGGGSGSRGWCADTDRMTFVPTLTGRGGYENRNQGQSLVTSFNWQRAVEQGADVQEERTGSLATSRVPAVAYPITMRGRDDGAEFELGEANVYNSLRAGDGGSSRANACLTPDLAVRRLTPRECERLMGWPDDWTRWADDGTQIADSHRYRMCGNGVVAPVAEWIGRRLPQGATA